MVAQRLRQCPGSRVASLLLIKPASYTLQALPSIKAEEDFAVL